MKRTESTMGMDICQNRRQKGLGLLEVLITLVVMGVGMLGMVSLQLSALRNTQSAEQQANASILAVALLEAMRTNRSQVVDGSYNLSMTCAPSGNGQAGKDITWLHEQLQRNLGKNNACMSIVCSDENVSGRDYYNCAVTVQWDDSRGQAVADSNAAGGDARQIVLKARL